jgi:hypothetical protein
MLALISVLVTHRVILGIKHTLHFHDGTSKGANKSPWRAMTRVDPGSCPLTTHLGMSCGNIKVYDAGVARK